VRFLAAGMRAPAASITAADRARRIVPKKKKAKSRAA
jgi:hypothetical protein